MVANHTIYFILRPESLAHSEGNRSVYRARIFSPKLILGGYFAVTSSKFDPLLRITVNTIVSLSLPSGYILFDSELMEDFAYSVRKRRTLLLLVGGFFATTRQSRVHSSAK